MDSFGCLTMTLLNSNFIQNLQPSDVFYGAMSLKDGASCKINVDNSNKVLCIMNLMMYSTQFTMYSFEYVLLQSTSGSLLRGTTGVLSMSWTSNYIQFNSNGVTGSNESCGVGITLYRIE